MFKAVQINLNHNSIEFFPREYFQSQRFEITNFSLIFFFEKMDIGALDLHFKPFEEDTLQKLVSSCDLFTRFIERRAFRS
jgi:hypothetical protein